MRLITGIVICLALMWMADVFFFKGQCTNQLWGDAQYQAQKLNYEVRRLIKF